MDANNETIIYLRTLHPEPTRPLCKVCNQHQESNLTYGCRSCNACTQAFRRFIDSGLTEQCKYQNNCTEILQGDAYRCHACRFYKCIEIGMKPELVRAGEPDVVERNMINVRQFLNTRIFNSRSSLPSSSDDQAQSLALVVINPKVEEPEEALEVVHSNYQTRKGIVVANREEFWIVSRDIFNETTLRAHLPAMVTFAKSYGFYPKVTSNIRIKLLSHFANIMIIVNNDYAPLFENSGAEQHLPQYLLEYPSLLLSPLDSFECYILQSICMCDPSLEGLPLRYRRILLEERTSHVKSLFDYCSWNATNQNGRTRYREIIGLAGALEKSLRLYYTNHSGRMIPVNEIMTEHYEDIMLTM